MLAQAAGHTVTHCQMPTKLPLTEGWTISGRIDAIIDDVLVDVKSCSPYGYAKFKEGLTNQNDSFGYRAQLGAYSASLLVQGTKHSDTAFVAVDKQNGHIGVFKQGPYNGLERTRHLVSLLQDSQKEPPREFDLEPEGTSGNKKLCTECSYCSYKWLCWRDANNGEGLKMYAYSSKPMFLGTVNRVPKVPEVTPVHNVGIEAVFEIDKTLNLLKDDEEAPLNDTSTGDR